MSPELNDGKVTLKKNESLQLFERKQAKFQHQTSVIKSTHQSYDKKISFQVGDLYIQHYNFYDSAFKKTVFFFKAMISKIVN